MAVFFRYIVLTYKNLSHLHPPGRKTSIERTCDVQETFRKSFERPTYVQVTPIVQGDRINEKRRFHHLLTRTLLENCHICIW